MATDEEDSTDYTDFTDEEEEFRPRRRNVGRRIGRVLDFGGTRHFGKCRSLLALVLHRIEQYPQRAAGNGHLIDQAAQRQGHERQGREES